VGVSARIHTLLGSWWCGSQRENPKSGKSWESARESILFLEVLSSRRYYCGTAIRRFTGDGIRELRHNFTIRHDFATAPA
jgi:hypothetical protein